MRFQVQAHEHGQARVVGQHANVEGAAVQAEHRFINTSASRVIVWDTARNELARDGKLACEWLRRA